MDRRIDIFKLFETEGRKQEIMVFPAISVDVDPYEKTTSNTFLNPIPIYGIITHPTFSSLRWKFFGQLPSGSIQFITQSGNLDLLLLSTKIEFNGDTYSVYKDDSKSFQYIQRDDYIVIVLERTNP
jgi:hypothetical protein